MAEEDSKAVMLGIIVKPWPYKALTALGVTATSFVAGQTAALTYSTLPAIMDSTAADLARHWRKATDAVSRPSLVLSVVGAGSFAVLAYRGMCLAAIVVLLWLTVPTVEPARDTSSFRLYTAATTILAAGYAYDALVTRPVNDELVRREELSRSNPSAFALSTSGKSSVVDLDDTHETNSRCQTPSLRLRKVPHCRFHSSFRLLWLDSCDK